ncbi:MAG: WD40/YVTN/BNR-like repeat-containing protein, partial [Candidatus Kapaibacterium sp.]
MNRLKIIAIWLFFASAASAQQQLHWELTNGPGTDAPRILEVNTNGDIIVGSDSVILRSSDHGMHWHACPNSGSGYDEATATLPGGRIVVLTVASTLVRFESDGSGRTILTLPSAETLYADRAGNLYSIVGPSSFFFSNGNDSLLARSTNAGDTWQMIPGPKSESMKCFAADDEHYYVATDSGIYISSDSGTSWQRCRNGIPSDQYYNVTTGHDG